MKMFLLLGLTVLSTACARRPAQSMSETPRSVVRKATEPVPISDVAADLVRWQSLGETIPAQLPDTAWVVHSEGREARVCRPAEGYDYEPDVLTVTFADDVRIEQQRAILDQVQARAIRRVFNGYLVLLRPTGRCDAPDVAKLLLAMPGVTRALPYVWIPSGDDGQVVALPSAGHSVFATQALPPSSARVRRAWPDIPEAHRFVSKP